jgi:hypothetical protein
VSYRSRTVPFGTVLNYGRHGSKTLSATEGRRKEKENGGGAECEIAVLLLFIYVVMSILIIPSSKTYFSYLLFFLINKKFGTYPPCHHQLTSHIILEYLIEI